MPPTEYLFEWLGAAMARRIGLAVPEPLAVTITSELARGTDFSFVDEVLGSMGIVFGSRYIKAVAQMPRLSDLTPSQCADAARLLAFDVFVHNVDRRATNHNLFISREKVVVFDQAATPVEWTVDGARGKLAKIVEVLKRRRDAVDEWLPKVLACLHR